jgi:hypothetical protein
VNRVPLWRILAGFLVLAGLLFFAVMLVPVYAHNFQLQSFVSGVADNPANRAESDDLLRTWVLDKAHALDLPVTADNVQIYRSPGNLRIDIRYFVPVSFPGYTVSLHFSPGAGSR